MTVMLTMMLANVMVPMMLANVMVPMMLATVMVTMMVMTMVVWCGRNGCCGDGESDDDVNFGAVGFKLDDWCAGT